MDLAELWADRRVKVGVIVAGVMFFCYVTYYNWITRVHRVETNISQYWDLLIRVSDERLTLLPAFAKTIVSQDPNTQPIANDLIAVYTRSKAQSFDLQTLNDPTIVQNFVNQQQNIATGLRKMQSKVGTQMGQNERYQALTEALEAHDLQIQYAAHALEKSISEYNTLLEQFPGKIVNKATHFQFKYFPEVPTLES